MEENKIEKQVAQTILQQAEEVTVGDRTYKTAPPSIATLILASEAVSRLQHIPSDTQHVLEVSLAYAKDCRPLGEIAAILILGARHITETVKTPQKQSKRYLWGLFKRTKVTEVEQTVNRKDELTDYLLEFLTPKQLHELIARLLKRMQIADFFGLTTFLTEINLLRQTKVEN